MTRFFNIAVLESLVAFTAVSPPVQAGPLEDARAVWQPLADSGDRVAQYYIGLLHDYGYGVTVNDEDAAKRYRLSADEDYHQLLNDFGVMYEPADGVEQNTNSAIEWYEKAREAGEENADTSLTVARVFRFFERMWNAIAGMFN